MEAMAQAASQGAQEDRAVFIVWSPPTHGSGRSRFLSNALGIRGPTYFYSTKLKGEITAPLRYILHSIQTIWFLFRKRPRMVLVQHPPSYAVMVAALYCAITGSRYIIDAHSDAFQRGRWMRPAWLLKRLTRRAAVNLVSDSVFVQSIEQRGGKAMILRTLGPSIPSTPTGPDQPFTVTVVNTFAFDEPVREVLNAAALLPDVRFYITGKLSRATPGVVNSAPKNVVFTDYLPRKDYDRLLGTSHAVVSLTTRDHTFQCGASEALAMERPVITSDWPLLREYFNRGTVHVDNTAEGIRRGIEEMRREHSRYAREIIDLHQDRRAEWQQRTSELAGLIYQDKT